MSTVDIPSACAEIVICKLVHNRHAHMSKEMKDYSNNMINTWEFTSSADIPKGCNTVEPKWVCKLKLNIDCSMDFKLDLWHVVTHNCTTWITLILLLLPYVPLLSELFLKLSDSTQLS